MKNRLSMIFLCLLSLSLLGCGKKDIPEKQATVAAHPLTWYPPLSDLSFMERKPRVAMNKTDLQQLLKIKWNHTIQFNSTVPEKEATSIGSCQDYLSKDIKGIELTAAYEWYLYMRAALLCEAVEIVTNGKDSTSSNIGKITFDKTFADVLPIQLAFFVSTSNKKEVLANNQGKSWSSFDKIEGVKKIDDYSAEYRIEEATQTISVLARGDFNGDKMEDILLFVRNSITGASHSPTRLFVLTRYQGESMFRFVKEYKLRSVSD